MSDERESEAGKPSDASKAGAGARVGHRWAKGESGNWNGRRPDVEVKPVRDLARRYTVPAIRRLAQLMRSKNEKVSAFACTALLDRGWGRPPQAVTGPDGAPLGVMVGMVAGAPTVVTPESAAQAYLEIMRNPAIDLSAVTFESSTIAPQPVEAEVPSEPTQQPACEVVEVGPLPDYPQPMAPPIEPLNAPYDGNVIGLWSRLGK